MVSACATPTNPSQSSHWITVSSPADYPIGFSGGNTVLPVLARPQSLGYLLERYQGLPPTRIEADLLVEGNIEPTEPCPQGVPTVRLIIKVGDEWAIPTNRWWNPNPISLTSGLVTIREDLTGEWVHVYGQKDPPAFEKARIQADRIGLTFGSPCAAGHGITGDGKITLTRWVVR